MADLNELAEDSERLLALEPEEVALLVLRELVAQERQRHSGPLNRQEFSQRFRNLPDDNQRALMEAWAWLERVGCLAQLPQQPDGWYFVTRWGNELAKSADKAVLTREATLPRHLLHPVIEQRVWSKFLRAEYDSAVFEAFKQVEVAIRIAGGFPDTEIGTALTRKAFHVETGPLTDNAVVASERQALSDLVSGALGSYKNPHSHRNVVIGDAVEAAEMIILASHLLRIVDARKPPIPS